MELIRQKLTKIDPNNAKDYKVDPKLLQEGQKTLYHSLRRWLQRRKAFKPRNYKPCSSVPLKERQAVYDAAYLKKKALLIPKTASKSKKVVPNQNKKSASKISKKKSKSRNSKIPVKNPKPLQRGWPNKLTNKQKKTHLSRQKKFFEKNLMTSECVLCCEFFWCVLRDYNITPKKKVSIEHLLNHGAGEWVPEFVKNLFPRLDSIYSVAELSEKPWCCRHRHLRYHDCDCPFFDEVYKRHGIPLAVKCEPTWTALDKDSYPNEYENEQFAQKASVHRRR